jgi:hypothetical protein
MNYSTYQEYEQIQNKQTMNNTIKTTFSLLKLVRSIGYALKYTDTKGRALILTSLTLLTFMVYLGARTLIVSSIITYNNKADQFAYNRVLANHELQKQFVSTVEVPVIDAEAASTVLTEAARSGASDGAKNTVESYLNSPKVK